jgi:RNA polymerase sigma-70 factor (ECF subfamily)
MTAMIGTRELPGIRPALLRFAQAKLHDRHRAEDAVQETLLAAMEGVHRFAGESSASTWLFGILKHKIVDCIRATERFDPLEHDGNDRPLADSNPEMAVRRTELVLALERAMGGLSPAELQVFELRILQGLSTDETCARIGISKPQCWVTLHRARSCLRACEDLRWLAAHAGEE